ncbi:MAG: AAA family ATPase [Woeseiaceae bacterium]|nr:AAA family ATPase [Woeseiaceae bacterium]
MDWTFVSRDRELRQMDGLLARAMGGAGQVCMVTGEAGLGKTSLTAEFARRAEQQHEDLLVAIGDCNSQTGVGDPYLPFREVLGMLAGDIDDRVAQGMTTEENANRLRSFLRVSKRIIKEVGPDLIDIFVPGVGVATRASTMVAQSRGQKTPDSAVAYGGSKQMEQVRIFEQVTRVLVTLSQQRPLIIVLDDLHWIDPSSATLLFHLARRIEGSRILLVGTYRPEEVALERGNSRHPMAQVVPELKRLYGDIVIALTSKDESDGRDFVAEFLDSKANEFSDAFRERLYQQTSGHPLFTTELIRHMCDTGALVKNADGRWAEGAHLDWDILPARAEGAIEERINRLGAHLQEVLSVAAVQGPVFTAEVIAQIVDVPERKLVKTLMQELGRVHLLVSEEGTTKVGSRRVFDFRFRHQLFQKYLYERLGAAERQLIHEDVGVALEDLYADNSATIAGKMAFHFEHAGMPERAAGYYRQAARRAADVYAYREAVTLAKRGIALLESEAESKKSPGLLIELQLLLGEAEHHCGQFAASMAVFREAAQRAQELGNATAAARAAIGYSEPGWRYNLIDSYTSQLLRIALTLLDDVDSTLRSRVMANLAAAIQQRESDAEALQMLSDATAIAQRIDDPRAIIECTRLRFHMDRDPHRINDRVQRASEALRLSRQLDDTKLQLECQTFRLYDLVAVGDIAQSNAELKELLTLAERYGDPFYIYHSQTMKVAHLILKGNFEDAESLAISAMQTGQQLGVDHVEGVLGLQMFTIRREQGRLQEIAPLLENFVREEGVDAAWRPGLALIYADLGCIDDARRHFDELAQEDFRAVPRDSLWQTCLTYLAETCDALQDTRRALKLYEFLRPYSELALVVGNVTACLGAASRPLGQLASTMEEWDTAEQHFQHALELNQKMDAKPWMVRTRYQYARMLARRGNDNDTERSAKLIELANTDARTLGMQSVSLLRGV